MGIMFTSFTLNYFLSAVANPVFKKWAVAIIIASKGFILYDKQKVYANSVISLFVWQINVVFKN